MRCRTSGVVAVRQGHTAQARGYFAQSAALCWAFGDVPAAAASVRDLARVAYKQGRAAEDLRRAVRLYGTAAVLDAIGPQPPTLDDEDDGARLTALRAQLSDAAFELLWAEGQALPPEQAIANVLADGTAAGASGQVGGRSHGADLELATATGPAANEAAAATLTGREREVLRLVAQGLRTGEVAAALGLSPRTVDVHLRAIYRKLGVRSRTAATRVAIEQHLV